MKSSLYYRFLFSLGWSGDRKDPSLLSCSRDCLHKHLAFIALELFTFCHVTDTSISMCYSGFIWYTIKKQTAKWKENDTCFLAYFTNKNLIVWLLFVSRPPKWILCWSMFATKKIKINGLSLVIQTTESTLKVTYSWLKSWTLIHSWLCILGLSKFSC